MKVPVSNSEPPKGSLFDLLTLAIITLITVVFRRFMHLNWSCNLTTSINVDLVFYVI